MHKNNYDFKKYIEKIFTPTKGAIKIFGELIGFKKTCFP